MATKTSAAETELAKVEAEYIKLHPLASTGNDVAPITRGELRMILEDMLGQMAGGASASPADLTAHLKQLDDLGARLMQMEGKLMREKESMVQRIEALETGALSGKNAKAGGGAPASPAADAPKS